MGSGCGGCLPGTQVGPKALRRDARPLLLSVGFRSVSGEGDNTDEANDEILRADAGDE